MPATLTVTRFTNPSKLAIDFAEPPFCKAPTVKETESNDPKENTKSASDISDVTTPDELKN